MRGSGGMMCEFCEGKETEYQHTYHTKIYIGTFGKRRTLEVEAVRCPPFARCSSKNIPVRSAFYINFCPECGRDLRDGEVTDDV